MGKKLEDQMDYYDGWEKTQANFYEEVVEFYKGSLDVKCYEKGGECGSDIEGE